VSAARGSHQDSVNNEAAARPVLLRGTCVVCAMAGCAMSVPVPDFFTLPEVGRILRIGRNSAYKAATEYEKSGGVSGLPFVRFGKLKRVSRVVLENLKGGPTTWPLPDDERTVEIEVTQPPGGESTPPIELHDGAGDRRSKEPQDAASESGASTPKLPRRPLVVTRTDTSRPTPKRSAVSRRGRLADPSTGADQQLGLEF
jgi:hypothetical protein